MSRWRLQGLIALALGGLACAALRAADPPADRPREEVIVGLTRDAAEGNINDIKAATKVWIEGIVNDLNLSKVVVADVRVFDDSEGLRREVEADRLDVAVLSTRDFLAVGGAQRLDALFAYERNQSTVEEYLMLVRRDAGLASLADLRGKSVAMLHNIRTSLAEPWLDRELQRANLPPLRQLAGQLVEEDKATHCVHGVFFRKNAACLINAHAYRTICELNPQIGRDLVTLAASPPYVPSLVTLRRGYTSELRPILERSIREVHKTTRGQQILTVYMIDRLVQISTNELSSACELLGGRGGAP